MAMDFFEHQDVARRKSGLLVVYFIVAVILIVVSIYGAAVLTGNIIGAKTAGPDQAHRVWLWSPPLLLGCAVGTVLLVTSGSLYKMAALRDGGESVALMLGGRLVDPNSSDLHERKLLNVVEEMAIASGIPVPPVYVLDEEDGINAFAAGYSSEDAVIGVTRGCMRILSRDELQGVIAHEFSHILNGDMRLNIRLIGVLHGILLIGLAGYFLLRMLFLSGGSRRRSSRRGKGGGGILAVALFAVLLIIIGFVGVFFGKLIKSALSRQREYLADASAVQFTRNPEGIAGALKKIGGLFSGSKLQAANAEQASHLFFGDAIKSAWFGAMATHPPLDQRIRRIDPAFDGAYPDVADEPEATGPPPVPQAVQPAGDELFGVPGEARPITGETGIGQEIFGETEGAMVIAPAVILSQIGSPNTAHLEYARKLRESIPPGLLAAAREAYGARAVIYGLLLDRDENIRSKQLARLRERAEGPVYEDTVKLVAEFDQLHSRQRLPLIDIAMPALQALSEPQFNAFRDNVQYLAEADEEVSLFEYTLQGILVRNLAPKFSGRKPPVIKYYSLKGLGEQCAVLLSTLARQGTEDEDAAAKALAAAAPKLDSDDGLALLAPEQCGLARVDEALKELRTVSPKHKRMLLDACIICIAMDGKITVDEAELLRSVADALGCPMPPVLPGQQLEA